MKKLLKNKKAIIIALCAVVVIALSIGGVCAVNAYNEYQKEQKIETSISEITERYNDFLNETDRAKKLEILNTIENEFNEYTSASNDECFEEVKNEYISDLAKMKKYFTDEYNQTIEDNTLEDIDKIDDKDKINKCKDNLDSLLVTITNEKDIVCSDDEFNSFKEDITELVDTYETRIEKIEADEKAAQEAAEKAKAAEEKKKAEEEATKTEESTSSNSSNNSTDNSSNYSYNDNNNSNSSSNNSSSSSNNSNDNSSNNYSSSDSSSNNSNDSSYTIWKITGDEYGTIYKDSNNNYYDNDGNFVYNGDGDGWYNP